MPTARSPLLLAICASFLVLAAGYLSFGGYRNWPQKVESDGKYYYQFLISAWYDGDLDFANNYRASAPPWMTSPVDHYVFRNRVHPVTGRPTSVFTCGPALLWVPFFATAQLTRAVHDAIAPATWEPGPWSYFTQRWVMFAAVGYACLGLALLPRVTRALGWNPPSAAALLSVLFASPLAYYVVFEASMSHAYDFFSLSLVIWAVARTREPGFVGCALAGAVCALHVLVRTQNLVTVMLMAMAALPYWSINSRAKLARFGVFLLATVIGSLPLVLINLYLFAAPWVVPQTVSFGARFLDPWHPHLVEVLFSQRNGLFSHHPFLLLGLAGFVLLLWRAFSEARPERWLWAALGLAFLAQVYVNATVADWWAGHSFGQRRLVMMLPLFAFGFMELAQRLSTWRPSRVVVPVVTGLAVTTGIYLTFIHVFLWDYDQPHNIWWWMFVEAPTRWLP